MGAEVAAIAGIIGAVAGAAGATNSYISGKKEQRRAKTALRNQERAIADENARALEVRKSQVDQQRAMYTSNGQGTRGISTSGIKANIYANDKLG